MNNLPAAQKEGRSIESLLRDPKVLKGLEGVATQYLTPDRMARITVNAIRRTPKLATCNPQSVLGAVMLSCSLGLEPNTPMGQAYLIPYDKRGPDENGKWVVIGTECQFIIGYRGFVSLAKRNPSLVKLYAATVHQNDDFDFCEGSESFLRFKPSMVGRGEAIGAFCFTKERGERGDIDSATVLPMEEIEKIRSCSETYSFLAKSVDNADTDYKRKKAEEKLAQTPWVKWFGEMAAKSAIRRHVKQLDLTAHLSAAVAIDEAGDASTIDMGKMMDADYTRAVVAGEEVPELIEQAPVDTPQLASPERKVQDRIVTPITVAAPEQAPTKPEAPARKTKPKAAAPVEAPSTTQARTEWPVNGADGETLWVLESAADWAESVIDWVNQQSDLADLQAVLDANRALSSEAMKVLPPDRAQAITAAVNAKLEELTPSTAQTAQTTPPHDPETGEVFDEEDDGLAFGD